MFYKALMYNSAQFFFITFFLFPPFFAFQQLRDPSGNSFIENLCAPSVDPAREVTTFNRTKKEDHALGIYTQEELNDTEPEKEKNPETIPEEETAATAAAGTIILYVSSDFEKRPFLVLLWQYPARCFKIYLVSLAYFIAWKRSSR